MWSQRRRYIRRRRHRRVRHVLVNAVTVTAGVALIVLMVLAGSFVIVYGLSMMW